MQDTRTVGRNVAFQIAGRAGGAVLGLALAATLTRALSFESYGSYSAALAVLGLLAVVHEFGMLPIASRTLARDLDQAGPLLGTVVAVRVASALPLAGLGLLGLLSVGEAPVFAGWAGGVFALVLVGRGFESVDVVLQVAQRMGRSVTANLAGRAGNLLAVLGLAGAGVSRPGPFLAAAAVGTAVSTGLRLRLVRPWLRLPLRWTPGTLRPFLREASPAGVAALFMAGYLHADTIIVRGLAGAREAALYHAPYRLFMLGAGLAGLVMVSAAPILSARWAEDRAGFRRRLVWLLTAGTVIAFPVALLVAWRARPILGLLFGAGYGEAAGTLALLAFAAAAAVPGTVATSALISADRAAWTARLAAVALVGNVALDLWLVPSMGGRGAALATLVTEVVVVLVAATILLWTARRAR